MIKRIKQEWGRAVAKRHQRERQLIIATALRLLGDDSPRPFTYSYQGKTYHYYGRRKDGV